MTSIPIYCNLQAGGGGQAEGDLQIAFTDSALTYRLEQLPPAALARTTRAAVAAGAAVVGVAGGDGSVSAVAGELVDTDTALAVFPGGTLNHFAYALGIRSYADTVAALAAGRVMKVDVAEVNGRIFINNASLGLYPRQLWIRQRWEPRIGKWPAAAVATSATFLNFYLQALYIESSGVLHSRVTPLLWIGAGRGGFQNPRTMPRELDSGVLEVVLVSARSRRDLARLALRALRYAGDALTACEDNPNCEVHHGKEFVVTSRARQHLGLGIDGELARLSVPLRFRIRPRALKVYVGEREEPRD